MSEFIVVKGPLGMQDAGTEWMYGPFIEGGKYSCSVFTTDVGKALARQWLKEGKIRKV